MAKRYVVIGNTGLIGSAVCAQLERQSPEAEILGLSPSTFDLTDEAELQRVAGNLRSDDVVIMCAGVKRQLGDSLSVYMQNMEIAAGFCRLIEMRPVAKVLYFSSAAVYGEDVENLAITEDTPVQPRTYYGLAKIGSEWIIARAAQTAGVALGILRPATVYGPGDLGTAYGPSGFLNNARKGAAITLWGDGSELREFVYVDDVAKVTCAFADSPHEGILNLASGTSYTFQDALSAALEVTGASIDVSSKPRSKDKVDNRFDVSRMTGWFPDITFTTLQDGMAKMNATLG